MQAADDKTHLIKTSAALHGDVKGLITQELYDMVERVNRNRRQPERIGDDVQRIPKPALDSREMVVSNFRSESYLPALSIKSR